jgi:hypothetical protein
MGWMGWVLGIVFMLTTSSVFERMHHTRDLYDAAYAIDTTRNFGIYVSKAQLAYSQNSTYSGVLPQAALNLPSWYRPAPGLTAFANAGHLFVYQQQPDATTGGRVLKQIAGTGQIVGMCIGGTIYSTANMALMAAPLGMPNLAVVIIVV